MSAPSTPASAPSPSRARTRWPVVAAIGSVAVAIGLTFVLPGGWRHARTVFGGKDDVPAPPKIAHEVSGLIELRPQDLGGSKMSAEEYERYCNRQVLFLKSREVLQAALADPALAALETVQASPDPLELLREGVRTQTAATGVIAVSMAGERVDDLKAIVDAVMRSYASLAPAAERREREQKIEKLEAAEREILAMADSLERQTDTLTSNKALNGESHEEIESRFRAVQRKLDDLQGDILAKEMERAALDKRLGAVRLTDQSLADLRASKLHEFDYLLEKLKPLIDRQVANRPAFFQDLGKVLSQAEVHQFGTRIFNAAHLPTVQLPAVSEEAVAAAVRADESVAALTKERDSAAQRYEKVKEIAANPAFLASHEKKLKQANQELELRRKVVRKQVIVTIQAAEISGWRSRTKTLEDSIAATKSERQSYQKVMTPVQKALAAEAESRATLHQIRGLVADLGPRVRRVRGELDRLRLEAKVDARPRIRQAAQEQE